MEPVVLPHDVHGSGAVPVLALHGWFNDRRTFQPIAPYLDGDTFTYAIPDLRGYGEAASIHGAYSVGEIANDALALADHLGWERFCVIGHSMGGKAAQVLASIGGPRVRRIVGVSPAPAASAGFDDDTKHLFARAVDDPSARRTIIDWSTGRRLPGRWLDAIVRRSLECSAREAFAGYLSSWSGEDFHEQVDGCEVPALAIVGAHDPDLGAETMRRTWLRWLPRGEVREIADAGHYAMDETPLTLLALAEAFLR